MFEGCLEAERWPGSDAPDVDRPPGLLDTFGMVGRSAILPAVLTLAAACGYTQTRFSEWRSSNPYYEGNGGTVEHRNGIDIWTSGEPDRPFELLGVIDTAQSNAANYIAYFERAGHDAEIINTAKENGGDAIVLLNKNSQITGYTTRSSAYAQAYGGQAYGSGRSTTQANTITTTQIAVVRYLTRQEIAQLQGGSTPSVPAAPISTTMWDVAIIVRGGDRIEPGTRMVAVMRLNQQGTEVAGQFAVPDGPTGTVRGVVHEGVFEFQVVQEGACPGQFRGQAAIQEQGQMLAGTYVGGDSCVGQVNSEFRAILRRQ
jgi:hypothetical protein